MTLTSTEKASLVEAHEGPEHPQKNWTDKYNLSVGSVAAYVANAHRSGSKAALKGASTRKRNAAKRSKAATKANATRKRSVR